MQIRRIRDYKELFGCYLTDNLDPDDDPADKDENLKVTLEESNKNFERNINEVRYDLTFLIRFLSMKL